MWLTSLDGAENRHMTRNVCTVYIAGPLVSCSLLLFVVCSVLAELWLRPWQSLSQDVVGRAHAHRTDTLGLSVKETSALWHPLFSVAALCFAAKKRSPYHTWQALSPASIRICRPPSDQKAPGKQETNTRHNTHAICQESLCG